MIDLDDFSFDTIEDLHHAVFKSYISSRIKIIIKMNDDPHEIRETNYWLIKNLHEDYLKVFEHFI